MNEGFNLNSSDVAVTGGASHSGRSKARFSRALGTSDCYFTFAHTPTGVKVSGRVISGQYSRKELTRLNQKLRERLYEELECEVAKFLKVAGRSAVPVSDDPDHKLFEIRAGEF